MLHIYIYIYDISRLRVNLLVVEINITKRNTESLLRVGSDSVLELRAGKTKCLKLFLVAGMYDKVINKES